MLIHKQHNLLSLSWVCFHGFDDLESFIDTNESAVNGAGVHHILEIIDDKRNPSKADTKKQEYDQSHHPDHGTTLIVDLCGHLHQRQV